MDRAREVKEVDAVCARLAERIPQLGAEMVKAAVRLAHSELSGGIRDYVPVLVEHNARDRLAAIAHREAQAPTGSRADQGDEPTA